MELGAISSSTLQVQQHVNSKPVVLKQGETKANSIFKIIFRSTTFKVNSQNYFAGGGGAGGREMGCGEKQIEVFLNRGNRTAVAPWGSSIRTGLTHKTLGGDDLEHLRQH